MKLMIILDSFCCLIMLDKMSWFKREIPDEELRRLLLSTDVAEQNRALRYLYRVVRPDICARIVKAGGSRQDAEEAFQRALLEFWLKLQKAKEKALEDPNEVGKEEVKTVPGLLSWSTYNRWLNILKDRRRPDQAADEIRELYAEQELPDEEAILAKARKVLASLSVKCRTLLELRYIFGFDRSEIAQILGFKTVESVSNAMRKCLDQARGVSRDLDIDLS